jgi:hypothetical protein
LEGGFHEGLATSAYFRRETLSIGIYPTSRNTKHKQTVALAHRSATMSGADRLIGGGAVGLFVSLKGLTGKEEGRSPYRE